MDINVIFGVPQGFILPNLLTAINEQISLVGDNIILYYSPKYSSIQGLNELTIKYPNKKMVSIKQYNDR